MCIFEQESLWYVKIDLQKYCKDRDFEVCAIKIHFNAKSACIIATQVILIHLFQN